MYKSGSIFRKSSRFCYNIIIEYTLLHYGLPAVDDYYQPSANSINCLTLFTTSAFFGKSRP